MRVIILAAGRGERLMPLTKDVPKPLIKFRNGQTLLERQLTLFRLFEIEQVIIVTGYKSEKIESYVKKNFGGEWIKIVYNPFYSVSNNLMSLWMARNFMKEDDFLVTNGDNLYSKYAFKKVLENDEEGIYLTISFKEQYDWDDMKVIMNEKREIIYVSKEIPSEKASAESVGLSKVVGSHYRSVFKNELESLARDPNCLNKYWLEIFNSLSSNGVKIRPIEIASSEWKEMDFHIDMKTIEKILENGFE